MLDFNGELKLKFQAGNLRLYNLITDEQFKEIWSKLEGGDVC